MNLEFVTVLGGYLLGTLFGLELLRRFSTSSLENWSGTRKEKWQVILAGESILLGLTALLFWTIRDPLIPNLGQVWMGLWFTTIFVLGGVLQLALWKWARKFLCWWTKSDVSEEDWPELEAQDGRPSAWEEVCRQQGIRVDQ